MTQYAAFMDGIDDNDEMDWFDDWNTAFSVTQDNAEKLENEKSLFLSLVTDGDFEDFPLQFRKEDGIVRQYKNSACLWI